MTSHMTTAVQPVSGDVRSACALASGACSGRDPGGGFAPLTDRFGRRHTYLRISLTDRCNLRCRYCMPAEGIPYRPRAELLSFEEITRVVRLGARMGIRKLRLTGGEPTMRAELPELVATLSAIEGLDSIGLTTNGLMLERLAVPLRAAGLTHLNVSLDTLRPERFERMTRRPGLQRVLAGIEAGLAAGFEAIKLNTVVIAGENDDELEAFAKLAMERPLYVRFIEYMPFRGNGWSAAHMLPSGELLARLRRRWPLQPSGEDGPHAVVRSYRAPGFAGSIGFISSMTEHFCDGCNRIRLTADGAVKSCLFQAAEVSLRDAMRSGADDAELALLMHRALSGKWARHPSAEQLVDGQGRAMTQIGG
ncbi:MAG: GTP 3',8-cyclase MoaA [Verrucomicrobiota bacterium]